MKLKMPLLSLLAATMTTSAVAADSLTDDQVEIGYRQALEARLGYRPDVAEGILTRLVDERPNAPQLRFDLAVSQAEQGQCLRASRTFSRGEDLAQTPSFARAAEIAMNDLCPRLAPWETAFGLSVGYDSNVNNGAMAREITVNGTPVILSDDAMAESAYGYTVNGSVAYNHQIGQAGYIVPSASLQFRDYEGTEHDQLTAVAGLSYRHRGDIVDWRVGPSLKWSFDDGGLIEKGAGIAGRAAWTISQTQGLYIDASYYDVEHTTNDLNDHTETSIGATYVHAFDTRNMVGRAGVSWSRMDYENDLQDLDSIRAEIGLSGSVTDQIGFDLSVSHILNEGSVAHPFFGVVRKDNVTTLSAQASFARFETFLGRPYAGVTHTVSESSFDMKDYERSAITFGITRHF